MNKINLKFLKELVDFNFLVLKNKKGFGFLNLLKLNTGLKQLIRSLQLLNKKESSLLYFWVENEYESLLINNFFYTKNKFVTTTTYCPQNSAAAIGSLFIIGDIFSTKYNLDLKLRNSNFFFVTRINSSHEKPFSSVLNLLNSTTDLKKKLFLLVLFKEILKTNIL